MATTTTTASSVSHETSTRPQELVQWLEKNYRITLSHIDWPVYFPNGGRGIGTVHDVGANKVVLSVPESLMLTSKRVRHLLQNFESFYISGTSPITTDLWNNDEYILTLFLLIEISKGTESFYYPYVQCLPSANDFVLLPWTWLPHQLELLKDTGFIQRMQERRNDIRIRYEQTVKIMQTLVESTNKAIDADHYKATIQRLLSILDWSMFTWCTACVQSRVFTYGFASENESTNQDDPFSMFVSSGTSSSTSNDEAQGMDISLTMIPFIDMLNHLSTPYSIPNETAWINHHQQQQQQQPNTTPVKKNRVSESTIDAEWIMLDEYNRLCRKDPSITKSSTHDTEIGYYVLRTNYTGLRANSQIYTYYGDLSSQALLETYGFILPYGENDDESLSITLPSVCIPTGSNNTVTELYKQLDSPSELELNGFPLIDNILYTYYQTCTKNSKESLYDYIQSNYVSLLSLWHYEGPCTETQQCLRILSLSAANDTSVQYSSVADFIKPVNRDNELRSCELLRSILIENIVKLYGGKSTDSRTYPTHSFLELVQTDIRTTNVLEQTEIITKILVQEEEIFLSLSDSASFNSPLPSSTLTGPPDYNEYVYPLWSPVGTLWEPPHRSPRLPYHDQLRYRTALQYRINILRTYLIQFQYLCYVHFIANGIPVSHIPGNQVLIHYFLQRFFPEKRKLSMDLLLPSFRIPYSVTKVSYGLEVQVPWTTHLLEKKKSIETRDYPLPSYLVHQPIALVEAPLGGLSKVGLDQGKIVGIIIFGSCRHYMSRDVWEKDSPFHGVNPSALPTDYGWIDGKEKYGWMVQTVVPVTACVTNIVLDESCRVFRSIFCLPTVIDIRIRGTDTTMNDPLVHVHDPSLYSQDEINLHKQQTLTFTTRKRNADIMSSKIDLTGVVSWPSTQLLGYILSQYPVLWSNQCILELGCGTGLLATVMANKYGTLYPAKCVLATDGIKDTLPIALYNMVCNEYTEYRSENIDCILHEDTHNLVVSTARSRIAIAPLMWGDETDIQYSKKYVQLFASLKNGQSAFDLIVASEVFYLHRGGENNWGIEQQAFSLFSTCQALFVKHGKTSVCKCHLSSTMDSTNSVSTENVLSVVPCGLAASGVLLLVYSPRYRNMAAAINTARQKLQLLYRSVDVSSLLTAEQRSSTLYTDTRMAIVSNCAESITELQKNLPQPLPLYPENYLEEDYYP